MSKVVTIQILDDNKLPTGESEEVVLSDAISNLVAEGVLTSDDEGVFFQRQLEYIQAQSYDVLYPELKGRTVFSNNVEGGEGINQITYRSYDKRGEAKIIAGKATDLPRADISGKEYTIDVRTIGTAYGYDRQEIAAAKLTGLPLDARKAEAARRAYEEKVNQLIWFGQANDNISGLLGGVVGGPWSTITNSSVAGSANGANTTEWGGADKTPTEIVADLTSALSQMVSDTKQIHAPNKILMSVAKRNYLMNTPFHLAGGVSVGSIMTYFLANNAYITSPDQIIAINELDGVFGPVPSPTAGGQGFIVLEEKEDNCRTREPFPFMTLPVQYKGLEFEINCYGRFAGLEIIRPAAISLWYGV